MKVTRFYLFLSVLLLIFAILNFNCTNDSISSDLDNSLLKLDTLSITDIQISNYTVYPNIGLNSKLYLGKKNGIEAPYIFIKMTNPDPVNYWYILNDTNVNVDSVRLILYSEDTTLDHGELPNLYFSPDSHFNENVSNYSDFETFSFLNWLDLGTPTISKELDDSSNFINNKLVWSLDSFKNVLYDSLDSNLTRTFGLQFLSSDSNYLEIFSEEAGYQTTDPKVQIYYNFQSSINDTIIKDTTFRTIYSASDLSVIKLNQDIVDTNRICISSGLGLRAKVYASNFGDSIPYGSLIKYADLILPIDSLISAIDYKLILDPIKLDSVNSDLSIVYMNDPYEAYGFPYRVSNYTLSNSFSVSVKEYLQNLLLENVSSLGFKIIADESNDPFNSFWLDVSDNASKPIIKIVYVKN